MHLTVGFLVGPYSKPFSWVPPDVDIIRSFWDRVWSDYSDNALPVSYPEEEVRRKYRYLVCKSILLSMVLTASALSGVPHNTDLILFRE